MLRVIQSIVLVLSTPLLANSPLTTLMSFNGSNGSQPYGGLIIDPGGKLYGTTRLGGADSYGTIFRMDSRTGALTTLASFNGADGGYPSAELLAGADGNFYGTTDNGGPSGGGNVFMFNPANGTVTSLVSFNGTNGGNPDGGLIADSAGSLYGVGNASVYRLAPRTGTLTTLATLSGLGGLGYASRGTLLADAAGNLYATASLGGPLNNGTVFKLDARTSTQVTLAWFSGSNGALPQAGLIADAAGNLYGTTAYGGAGYISPNQLSGNGTIFRLDARATSITTLASFDGQNGRMPLAALIADAAGNLYGTTSEGGENNQGAVFRFDAATGTLTVLASFNGTNGSGPHTGLVADGMGNLYGTTVNGGADNDGTVFKISNTGFVVPEPASLSLLASAAFVLVRRFKSSSD